MFLFHHYRVLMPNVRGRRHRRGSSTSSVGGTAGGGVGARVRLWSALALGVAIGVAVSVPGTWQYGLLLGWMSAAALFVAWTWFTIWPMNNRETAQHATRDDPGRASSDVIVVLAAVASLGAVGLLLGGAGAGGKVAQAALSFGSVALAWSVVHTMFTVRYARLYYAGSDGGVDFNENDPPKYSDFAYLAFTIGMTFQVSDTDLVNKQIRATALAHALLSYLFGVVIIAAMINLVAGLSK
jgi:uncharacterized membrane protein